MTEPDDFEQDEAALPGLEPPRADDGQVVRAARRTIAALGPQLTDIQAVMCQALLTTSRQLDRAVNSARAKDYGVAELVSQLRETYKVLVPDAGEGGEEDEFTRAGRELAEAMRRGAGLRDAEGSDQAQ